MPDSPARRAKCRNRLLALPRPTRIKKDAFASLRLSHFVPIDTPKPISRGDFHGPPQPPHCFACTHARYQGTQTAAGGDRADVAADVADPRCRAQSPIINLEQQGSATHPRATGRNDQVGSCCCFCPQLLRRGIPVKSSRLLRYHRIICLVRS